MSAAKAIMEARAASIHLRVDDDDLVLKASTKPQPVVLERLSRHKSAMVSLPRLGLGRLVGRRLARLFRGTRHDPRA
jgi:hypothetical protein